MAANTVHLGYQGGKTLVVAKCVSPADFATGGGYMIEPSTAIGPNGSVTPTVLSSVPSGNQPGNAWTVQFNVESFPPPPFPAPTVTVEVVCVHLG
jgi:hypothetical protein